MKGTLFAVLTVLALSACTSLPDVKGPYARSKGATPAVTDEGIF